MNCSLYNKTVIQLGGIMKRITKVAGCAVLALAAAGLMSCGGKKTQANKLYSLQI